LKFPGKISGANQKIANQTIKMKKKRNHILGQFGLAALLAIFLFSANSCDKNGDPPDPEPAKIGFRFTHYNQGTEQEFDTMKYLNDAGNPYLVNEIQYFISDIKLHKNTGGVQLLNDWKDIHYVDTDIPETHTWDIFDDIEPGQIQKITFTFGISGEKNNSLMFVNPPERDMFWPEYLGGGYHYMKLNGKWLADDDVVKPFDFHLGIGQIYAGGVTHVDSITGFVQNFFDVELPNSSFEIEEGEKQIFEIRMNIENWFINPFTYDHNDWGGDIMQKQDAMHIACKNGEQDVFEFIKLSGK
jgi:hypothetical protein